MTFYSARSAALSRFRPLSGLFFLWLMVAFLTRTALLLRSGGQVEGSPLTWLYIYGMGLFYDGVAACYFFLPLGLYLGLMPDRLFRHHWHQPLFWLLSGLTVFGIVFNAVSEWVFWSEFETRFNFIAIDYLLYTHEVIGNIRESYPVGAILSGLAVLSVGLLWAMRHRLAAGFAQVSTLRERLPIVAVLVSLPVLAFFAVSHTYKEQSPNRYVNELAGNGFYELGAAAYNNELDYKAFYRTLPEAEALATLRQQLPTPHAPLASNDPNDLSRTVSYPAPEKRLNVVLITVESLSAEFLGSFGNTQGITPRLDALAKDSLVFTRLYATGTRTVRGLEALSLSVPPTPGQSIVKRPNNSGLFSLGSVFARKGYDTRYVYGGYGYFDNMNAFFSGNRYQVVDRTAIPDKDIPFENIWGVADEALFLQAGREIDASWTARKPSFTMIMTTSNHRPFTYPEGRIDIPSKSGREGGVKYTDYAIGQFIDRARSKPWFDDTVFVVVADHCASSAGKTDLPVSRYRIPLLVYSPKHIPAGTFDRLTSQIDIPPTLLGRLNMRYTSRFLGYDMFDLEPGRERAFISTYQNLGFVTNRGLVTLSPKSKVSFEAVSDKDEVLGSTTEDPAKLKAAIAWYQGASVAFSRRLMADVAP